MEIKKILRKSKKNLYVLLIWNEFRRIKEQIQFCTQSDKEFVERMYKNKIGKDLNTDSPQKFTEKLQWIKLFYRNELMSQCADKFSVREYVKNCGYGHLLNDLIAVYENVNEIRIEELPSEFVLKGSHGSGWNIICTDKAKLKFGMYKHIMKSWMKQNIYYSGREWVYQDIRPRIICEKYIDNKGKDLKDYKIFCFNGIPKFIQVDGERYTNHKRVYYDCQWNRKEFQYGNYTLDYQAEKPEKLQEMLQIAQDLSAPFPFARVDLYDVEGRIIFGEITFFPDSGFAIFKPEEADKIIGDMLKLPVANYNAE